MFNGYAINLVYRRLDTSRINQLTKAWNEKTNYFLSQKNLILKDIFDENIEYFTVSKEDSDFSFIFHEGKSKATASSVYLDEYYDLYFSLSFTSETAMRTSSYNHLSVSLRNAYGLANLIYASLT